MDLGWMRTCKNCGSAKSGRQVDNEIGHTAMTRVLDLANVLELIVDSFYQGAFAQQQFVNQRHELVFHVFLQFGDQLNALFVEQVEQFL